MELHLTTSNLLAEAWKWLNSHSFFFPFSHSPNLMQMDMNGRNSNPLLPPEIITSILVRLPVKSLLRLRCVCKEWKKLFKTQSFITQHLLHSSLQNPFLFLEDGINSRPYRAWMVNTEMQIVPLYNHPLIHPDWYVRKHIHCNGLIFLHLVDNTRSAHFSLWNPATREMRIISEDHGPYLDWKIQAGFGFSSIVNDYKAVKIFDSWNPHVVTKVEVYSLNVGAWKRVKPGNLNGVGVLSQGLAFNGAIFWIGFELALMKGNQKCPIIVSFDVATEGFTLLPMPPLPSSIHEEYDQCLAVYDNKLAVLSNTLSEDLKSSSVHLWVMDEEGTSVSTERWYWTKKYSSNPYGGYFLHPVSIWKNEIICNVDEHPVLVAEYEDEDEDEAEPNGERKIVMFNFTTNEFRTFDLPHFVRGYGSFAYAESLVPLGNIHIEQV